MSLRDLACGISSFFMVKVNTINRFHSITNATPITISMFQVTNYRYHRIKAMNKQRGLRMHNSFIVRDFLQLATLSVLMFGSHQQPCPLVSL